MMKKQHSAIRHFAAINGARYPCVTLCADQRIEHYFLRWQRLQVLEVCWALEASAAKPRSVFRHPVEAAKVRQATGQQCVSINPNGVNASSRRSD
jgi:hypothetical protein